jgi:16S rRNA (guanine966-N2)-methyltransferase
MRIGAGRFKGRALPHAHDARPVPGRLRTSLFSVLGPLVEDACVLDLCAGVGALGLEALSRGARRVVLLDKDPRAVRALERWVEAAGEAASARVLCADAVRGPLPDEAYDLVFADPPFGLWDEGQGPALLERAAACVAPGGVLAVKVPAGLEVGAPPGLGLLRRVEQGRVGYALFGRVKSPEAPAD